MINLNAQYVNGLTHSIFAIHSGKLEKILQKYVKLVSTVLFKHQD